ncbi:MAG: hypothetical protein L0Z73_00395, partial [Gammaproteobacteria bacterium]|nr:hypothetical protein [Gammaproteobacteria bacterium]
MNINAKSLAIIVLVMGAAVVAAYQIGASRSEKETAAQAPQTTPAQQASPAAQAGGGSMPASHPPMDANAPSFTHFRVGNRNVKGMVAVEGA